MRASVVDAVSQAEAVLFAVWLDTEKELISRLSQALVGKVVIDPSTPIGARWRRRLHHDTADEARAVL